jgi:hypothetical protein
MVCFLARRSLSAVSVDDSSRLHYECVAFQQLPSLRPALCRQAGRRRLSQRLSCGLSGPCGKHCATPALATAFLLHGESRASPSASGQQSRSASPFRHQAHHLARREWLGVAGPSVLSPGQRHHDAHGRNKHQRGKGRPCQVGGLAGPSSFCGAHGNARDASPPRPASSGALCWLRVRPVSSWRTSSVRSRRAGEFCLRTFFVYVPS